jgi:hypothetical protein
MEFLEDEPADITADAKPHRCNGHYPVTVMERSVVNSRFRCYAKGNLAETTKTKDCY